MNTNTTVTDFRGRPWLFQRITRWPTPGRDDKVWVKDEYGHDAEFYWAVFPAVDFRNGEWWTHPLDT